jgi:3-dehydroquinate synthase
LTPETRTVSLGDRTYDIFFDRDIYPAFQEWICRFYPGGSVHVVTDRNVASIYGDDIRRWLSGIPHDVLALPPGEEHKNFETVGRIYGFLARGNAGRDSLVVAFGGGVVGDLAGFAAATYLRGISFVQVPTTLLSQVDSSVGGKTGFNLPEGKNLIGAFHQPRAVFIDDTFLLTLDERNLRGGLAEVIKCGLAGDAELWERLRSRGSGWKSFSGDDWQGLIRRAVAFKASVVEKDERESSLRKNLNLGHTIGHAMEKASGYGRLLHGEAVAMGLAWEAVLGRRLGVTGGRHVDALVSLLFDMRFELDDAGMPLSSIAAAIGMDKKRVLSEVDLPLIVEPGRCELRRVSLADIRQELPGIRAEIRERTAGRQADAQGTAESAAPAPAIDAPPGKGSASVRDLERRVAANPKDNRLITLLADAYRRSGNAAAAWEAIQVVLERNPSDVAAQRVAAELGKRIPDATAEGAPRGAMPLEKYVFLDDDAYEIRAAEEVAPLRREGEELRPPESQAAELPPAPDGAGVPPPAIKAQEPGPKKPVERLPSAPAVRTVTLADVYWSQGERDIARKIVLQILREDPHNERATAWMASHTKEDPLEAALGAFLKTTAKEYGYDLSGHH